MGINTLTLKFKEDLAQLINNSQLPPINILLVMENLHKEVNNVLLTQMQKETEEERKEEK